MDLFNSTFVYLPSHHIGVCKAHRQGVLLPQLSAHLKKNHQELTVATRKEIASAAATFHTWATTAAEVVYPLPDTQPLPCLSVYKDAFKCEAGLCTYFARGLRNIQAHCRQHHGWSNPRKGGRPHHGAPRNAGSQMWSEGAWCQKLQPTGQLGRLFEVSPLGDEGATAERGELRCALDSSFAQSSVAIEQAQQDAHSQIEPDNNRYVWRKWLKRSGWARHLGHFDRSWLLAQLQTPNRAEKALMRVCWAVEMVIYKAQLASSPDVVGFPAVQYIERREAGAPDSESPFNARQTGKTMAKYSRVWLSIVCYIWRTRDLAEPERQAADGRDDSDSEATAQDKRVSGRKPSYRLTGRQLRTLSQIRRLASAADDSKDEASNSDSELDEEGEQELERHVLTFLLSLLDHHVKDNYYKSALVSATAVLGVDRDRGWKSPLVYTTSLSAIVTVAKMLVLYNAVQAKEDKIADLMKTEGWQREDAEDMATSHVELVQAMVDRFMTLSTHSALPTPMDWVLRLRAYGKKIRGEVTAEGTVQWVGDTILHGYTQYSMPALRSMIHGLAETTRRALERDLLLLDVDEHGQLTEGATALPTIEWDNIVDNPAELRSGFNFLQDPRNTFGGVEGSRWLDRRVVGEKKLREAFVDVKAFVPGGSGVTWVEKRVQRYEKALQLFREHLLVLVHMTGGAPARGTELVTVTHTNMPNAESRGLFVEDGLMVYVTMYHKGIGQTGNAKVIHRYLPREVGELLFYYLWMVLPFWQKLERASSRRHVPEPSAFLWEPVREEAWAGPQRRKKQRLVDEDEEEDREEVGEEEEEGEESNKEERSTQTGSGRKRKRAAVKKPQRWGTDQVRRAIERVTLHWLQTKLNIQIWRHNTKATFRQYLQDKDILKALNWADNEGEEDVEDDPIDLGSGHGSKFAGQIYGRPIDESPFSIMAQRQALRRVSIAWHRFLQFSSTLKTPPAKGTRAAEARKEAVEEQFRRWKQMRRVDVQAALERLQGKGSTFRSVQQPAIEAIMKQKSPVVVIMGTGGGKSATFMLPASCSTGVTIVVVPVVALKQNMMDRCKAARIDCVLWDSQRPHEWASIVLVVPESVVTLAFEQFVNRQRSMGRLDRVVIDECHTILDSVKGWRTKVLKLRELVKAETQLVCLTATLKPTEESEFIRLMALPPKEQCEWFRAPTSRPNLTYRVHWYNHREKSEADVLTELVEEKKRQYPLPGQIVVYTDSREKTQRYAAMLGAVCYHREVGTPDEKLEILRQLTEGTEHVFVATNALGLGIDRETVRAVLFAGSRNTQKMRDVVQMGGRAGRGGLPSEVVFIRGATYSPQGKRYTGSWAKDTEEGVRELIEGDGCMRVVIDREMDGNHTREGCEPGEEPCGRCQLRVHSAGAEVEAAAGDEDETERAEFNAQLQTRRSLSRRERELESREQQEVQRLEEMLESWKACCQWCRAKEHADADQHQLAHCNQLQADEVRDGVKDVAKMVQEQAIWENFSCCFQCGAPQSICDSFEPHPDGGWQKNTAIGCQFEAVLLTSIMCVWTAWGSTFDDWVRVHMRREGIRRKEEVEFDKVLVWMGSTVWWGGIQSSKMCWVFVSFMSYIERTGSWLQEESAASGD